MSTTIIFFIFGFVLLLKGADILTDAASGLAKKLGIADFIIGVVVVGIGTSIPELIVTVFSNLQGAERIGLGTVVGSNTFNILGILGISAIIAPLKMTKAQILRHLPFNILAVLAVGLLVILPNGSFFGLTKLAGLLLIALFIFWIWYLHQENSALAKEDAVVKIKHLKPGFISLALVIAGLAAVIVGGEWVIQGSVEIARGLGLSETLIGLTIVGIGTSLPELVASAVAAYKKQYSIAVGNVVGSNIFDFLMILGVSSLMRPMAFTPALLADLWITAGVAGLLFIAIMIGKKYILERWEGVLFLLLYGAYIAYLLTIRS